MFHFTDLNVCIYHALNFFESMVNDLEALIEALNFAEALVPTLAFI